MEYNLTSADPLAIFEQLMDPSIHMAFLTLLRRPWYSFTSIFLFLNKDYDKPENFRDPG